jgi:hypothetical protein
MHEPAGLRQQRLVAESCRACGAKTEPFASATVLESVTANYERCPSCGMVMALAPTWLDDAYSAPITRLDIGLLDRCLLMANVTCAVLRSARLRRGSFLDWAGGYGAFTRIMRDRGYDFAHWDPMTENVFAGGHDMPPGGNARFDLVTGFEVLEHLVNPIEELAEVAASTDRLLMTTQVLPVPAPRPQDWWYYTLETGQHVTLFTPRSLQEFARRLGYDGVVTGSFLHLFHRGTVSPLTRALIRSPKIAYGAGLLASVPDRRRSLLGEDLAALTAPSRPGRPL